LANIKGFRGRFGHKKFAPVFPPPPFPFLIG